MVKRGRDEVGSGTGVFGFPPESAEPSSERVKTALAHVKHLNTEYLKDLTRKIAENPYCWHEKEAEKYKTYARRIRVRHRAYYSLSIVTHCRAVVPMCPSRGGTKTQTFRQVQEAKITVVSILTFHLPFSKL